MTTRGILSGASLAGIGAFLGLMSLTPSAQADGRLVTELRLGVMAHDQGIFSSHKESGADINAEVLLNDWGWLGKKVQLRPHFGATINTDGNTSFGYFGVTATAPLWRSTFAEFSFGGAVHSGNLDKNELGHKDLGCRLLFRESLSFGVNLNEHNSIAAVADHISNANFCGKNEGLETVGVRYGYHF